MYSIYNIVWLVTAGLCVQQCWETLLWQLINWNLSGLVRNSPGPCKQRRSAGPCWKTLSPCRGKLSVCLASSSGNWSSSQFYHNVSIIHDVPFRTFNWQSVRQSEAKLSVWRKVSYEQIGLTLFIYFYILQDKRTLWPHKWHDGAPKYSQTFFIVPWWLAAVHVM